MCMRLVFGYEAHVMRDGVWMALTRHMLHNAIFNELFLMTCLFFLYC